MKPEIYFGYTGYGFLILPILSVDRMSGWYSIRITIGWFLWVLEIEWPIE